MLNKRLSAAKSVFGKLMPTEQLIEEAILTNSRLAIAIIEGRQAAQLPITIGQNGLVAVSKANSALIEAREQIAQAHIALARDKAEIGLGARGMGDWGECPAVGVAENDIPSLRAVS